jgi:cyclic beta-1,2-glucan synthetase
VVFRPPDFCLDCSTEEIQNDALRQMSTTAPSVGLSPDSEDPIRAELFSVERLEQHAETLAATQTVDPQLKRGLPLVPRVFENGRVLLESYRALAQAVQQEHSITPAAEWLLDNFYIVDEQLRDIREDLPPGFYRKLPKLSSGEMRGYPRVFGIAWAFVAHTDSQFDPDVLRRFIAAYQRVQPLTIGELWAISITLRIVLVENLRRLAERIVRSRAARQEADSLADQLLGISDKPQEPVETILSRLGSAPLTTAFAVELLQRLRDVSPNVQPVLLWLDQRLAAQNTTADDIVRAEHQQQAAMNVTVRNIITSMRLMSGFNWRDFFESVSQVDEILRAETNFGETAFATRDEYRHAIEGLSRGSLHSEVEIAQRVVQHVRRARIEARECSSPHENRKLDPGYYLISAGRLGFERELGFRLTWRRRLLRSYFRTALPGYLGTIAATTALILALPLMHDHDAGVSAPKLLLLALLAAIPASDLAISLVHRAITDWLEPRSLPRLELRDGVPPELRTLVAVPTLLTSSHEIEELLGRLEIHYLSNPDGSLHFALLSDWIDAAAEHLPNDDELLAAAAEGIARLNNRYGPMPGGGERFLLLHRRRVWNESESKWMGWERKRGKLHELNRLLRGATNTTFIGATGRVPEALPTFRYVITLDSDTRMPRRAAYHLIGTIAHPLNRPEFSKEAGRVVQGYGIVQPRITPTLPTTHHGSLFERIFAGPSGIDAYSSAVSDVYQDLFREGTYTGKGVYDIDAFEAALAGKVPENTLLSHDLFEGNFARTALDTEIELFEEFPTHYETSAARQHRWARGDWQLLPWIFWHGPTGDGGQKPTSVPAVARWKMFDNLRRSLLAPATLLTLLAGWLIRPASPWAWTRFILVVIAIPALLPFLIGLDPRLGGMSKRSRLRALWNDLQLGLWRIGLNITFLAYQAWLMCDAMVRTLARMFFTRKNLLQWVTAAQAKYAHDLKLSNMYLRMAASPVMAAVTFAVLLLARHGAMPAAATFIALWAAAPAIARWISLPHPLEKTEPLTPAEKRAFRLAGRRTWHFFDTFVAEGDHALPPDNFQEDPQPVVAHRTSPTNIGLYLLSVLTAHDLGWIGITETVERLEATLATMSRVELFRGHLYNWYETDTLHPMEPKYVSSVDSGNLASNLLALSSGCRQLLTQPLGLAGPLAGIYDSIDLLREALTDAPDTRRTHIVTRKQLSNAIDAVDVTLDPVPENAIAAASRLLKLKSRANTMADIAQTYAQEQGDTGDSELRVWAEATRRSIESHIRDAETWIPWVRLGAKEDPVKGYPDANDALEWGSAGPLLEKIPTIAGAPAHFEKAGCELAKLRSKLAGDAAANDAMLEKIDRLGEAIERAASDAKDLIQRINRLGQTTEDMFHAMDFSFLYNESRDLLSIGYRVNEGALDSGCYDLLASEARIASFISIAKGDAPSKHWFRLGRALTPVGRGSALVSWSGSMFEYLMPEIVMHAPPGSLLNETEQLVVRRQIGYGAERHVPWGISECAFNARDIQLRYQYSGFGVPGLGLKRGLSEDLVIAPYATALASMIDPVAAANNFAQIRAAGGVGRYGFYEALDYTPTRVPEGKKVAPVLAYFAHHQGMSLVSLANVITDGAMQRRFHSEPIIKATELLLQERTPRDVLVARPRAEEVSAAARVRDFVPSVARKFTTPHDPIPRTQLLSNGRYSVMLTAAGSGYSRWRDIAVTRWREDVTRDCWGSYIYLRDVQTNQLWCAGYQPVGVEPDTYEACFYEDRAEITRRDRTLTTKLEVVVSPEDDAEIRRVSITNGGARAREIQVTSYAEICLTSQAADAAHPAFSNLFVQTEFADDEGALLATRRAQSDSEAPLWAAHVMAVDGDTMGSLEYETDRARFIGRGHSARDPVSVADGPPLSNTVGSVLDPLFSLRRTIRIRPGSTVHVIFTTAVAPSRDHALALADKHRDPRTFDRTLTMAWTQAQVQLHHWKFSGDEAHVFQRLANAVLYADASLRPSSEALERGAMNTGLLWGFGISGDRPIVLALIDDPDDIDIIRQLIRAHEYWRIKDLAVDLVVINEKPHSYAQDLQNTLENIVQSARLRTSPEGRDALGQIFLLRAELISPNARAMLQAVARAVLIGRRGTLSEQIMRLQRAEPATAPVIRRPSHDASPDVSLADVSAELNLFNGLGGFSADGHEYVTVLTEGLRTPQPWINVVANPSFGFIASESGSGCTWSLNSQENLLTPWSNDPVCDPAGEAIYIRDESTGEFWTPTALPIRQEAAVYVARYGQGYSRFQHASHGVFHDLTQFVPASDPVKISRLVLRNDSTRTRKLSVTAYAEYVLGSSRGATAPYVISEQDAQTGALLGRNAWGGDFEGRVAFADLGGKQSSWTCDRKEFLGRNGGPDHPAAVARGGALSAKAGAYLDPCAALRTTIELRPGGRAEIAFFLGQADSKAAAQDLLRRYRAADLDSVLRETTRWWDELLGTVHVKTPDAAMDLLLNRWLIYQTLACRIWARTAFYQASGAYGFRDQLQDVLALTVAKRDVTREHIVRAASRQFPEGDVQHWWHPPSGRGIRTKISDDLLWLPFAVSRFIETTGDMPILDETAPFIEGDALTEGQNSSYFLPRVSEQRATIFEHCARALDRSLAVGSHGLPLMGTGDWNDGMNLVGEHGKGESVWLAWFLHLLLLEFAKIADARRETTRAETWRLHGTALKAAVEKEGWDGEWYRRAYFDDGTPLGSSQDDECRIDSIAQSWGVISGAAEPGRAARAMDAVSRLLVNRKEGLVLLLTPPFDRTALQPGYIKAYVPGIRENGGQYTHAAVWTILAFAMMGDGDKAGELFRLINPIRHAASRAGVRQYKVEPYVVAGDVYSGETHAGRGGWTWYTGSAGWLYRVGIESILGFRLRGMTLHIDPCIPRNWPGYTIEFRYHSAVYKIRVENPSSVTHGVALTRIDGRVVANAATVALADDHAEHNILVVLG